MVNLTGTEKKVISILEEDGRLSASKIAKKIRMSAEGVIKVLNKLIEKKIILHFDTKINYSKTGSTLYPVCLKLAKVNDQLTKTIKKIILKYHSCAWHSFVDGEYDLILSINVRSKKDKDDMSQLLTELSNYTVEKDISIIIRAFEIAKSFLDGSKTNKLFTIFDRDSDQLKISEEEQKLITLIKKNARMNVIDLADKLKTTPKTIIARLKKLQKEEIIVGFKSYLDMAEIGYQPILALLTFGKHSKEEYNKFVKYIQTDGRISYFIREIGKYDVELTFNVQNTKEFYLLMDKIRNKFSFIRKITPLITKAN